MFKHLSNTSSGVPQLIGATTVGAAAESLEKVIASNYTILDVVIAIGGTLGGLGAFIGALVSLYNAIVARRVRKKRQKRKLKAG